MNRISIISVICISILILLSCNTNKPVEEQNVFNLVETLDLELIQQNKLNLTFNVVLDSYRIQRIVDMSSNNDKNYSKESIDFLSKGIDVDLNVPWSIKFKLSDSTSIQNNIELIDSLKILPSHWSFCWSSCQISENTNYEVIIVEKDIFQANRLNGYDIDKIDKAYNSDHDPILSITIKESGQQTLSDLTRENIGQYLAIVYDKKFFIYSLIEFEHVNGIDFK